MPDRTRFTSFLHAGRHVVDILRRRFDAECEVVTVPIRGLGNWSKPLTQAFGSHEPALAAGSAFALARMEQG